MAWVLRWTLFHLFFNHRQCRFFLLLLIFHYRIRSSHAFSKSFSNFCHLCIRISNHQFLKRQDKIQIIYGCKAIIFVSQAIDGTKFLFPKGQQVHIQLSDLKMHWNLEDCVLLVCFLHFWKAYYLHMGKRELENPEILEPKS